MNERITTLFLAGATCLGASAQISLNDPDNVPVVGNSFPIHKAAFAAPPAGGANVDFDYSALVETGVGLWTCIDPSSYSNAAAFPTASRAMANGLDTVFYNVTANGMERVGERQTVLIYSVECPMSDAALDLQLPLSAGDSWNDNIAASNFDVGGSLADRTGSVHGEADAWGTVRIPGVIDPFPVLRVYTLKQEVNVVHSGPPFGDITVTHKRHEWNYYGQWMRHPLVRVYSDSLTSLFSNSYNSGIEWLDPSVTAVAEAGTLPTMDLYPNPTSGAVRISAPGAVRMEVMDAAGRTIAAQRLATSSSDFDTQGLPAGVYTVSTFDAKGRPSRQRLVVN